MTAEQRPAALPQRTALYEEHRRLGARMVPFAGWEMPLQYRGIVEEHRAVRAHAGVFDVSHMGEVLVEGPSALEALQRLVTNDVAGLDVGRGLYTPICNAEGGIVDDVTVFRLARERYLMIVNAARAADDLAWVQGHAGNAGVHDISREISLLALQGPAAQPILRRLTRADLPSLVRFGVVPEATVAGCRGFIARSGYTGEDGFELGLTWRDAPAVWAALLEAGSRDGLVPVGLGARDTLRLEAGLMLYGNDIDETTTPLEARLGWTVRWEKGDFIGRDSLERQRREGLARRVVGFILKSRAIARHGHRLLSDGQAVGTVTSGSYAPTLEASIGMGYVPIALEKPGTRVEVDIRGQAAPAQVTRLPFYQRPG